MDITGQERYWLAIAVAVAAALLLLWLAIEAHRLVGRVAVLPADTSPDGHRPIPQHPGDTGAYQAVYRATQDTLAMRPVSPQDPSSAGG
jgi:hypothetical protein